MLRTILVALLVGLALLVACQPNEVVLEVTRLVERQDRVEVTRIVSQTVMQESTRLVTEEVPVEVVLEVTMEPLGTDTRPVQLLFPPLFDADAIAQKGEPLARSLAEATGYQFRVGILDSEQAVIDTMCAAPADTIGFLSPSGYVLAHDQCDVQVGNVAIGDDGLTAKTGMIVSRIDSGIDSLEDFQEKSWAVTSEHSLTNYLFFQSLLQESNIEVGETIPVAGESVAMLAVHDEEVDLATADFIPPIMPFEETLWDAEVDEPEPWRRLGLSPERSPIGYVLVNGEPENGGYRLRDARSRIIDVVPQIYDRTQIVALSAPIPNGTVAFGRDLPLALARQLEVELSEFAAGQTCQSSLCASDFYAWQGLAVAQDEMYEPIRFVRDTLDLSAEEMLELIQ